MATSDKPFRDRSGTTPCSDDLWNHHGPARNNDVRYSFQHNRLPCINASVIIEE